MEKKFLYFQPEYVGKFKCDGSRCISNCCQRPWTITIDKKTYKQYAGIKPKEKAREITRHMKSRLGGGYVLTLDENNSCPFLNENNLCSLQLEYGEDFLSSTCTSYPRRTRDFGKFFERSLTLTCPVAAELILFEQEPLKFELVDVPKKIHSLGGKLKAYRFPVNENSAEYLRELQATMISILQRRELSIDGRLIVLGVFLERLEEMIAGKAVADELKELLAIYRTEDFFSEQVLPTLEIFSFNAADFVAIMMRFVEYTKDFLSTSDGQKFIGAIADVLEANPDENNQVSVSEVAANYERLADARKNFFVQYNSLLENYLVNEIFLNVYPWRFLDMSVTKNFAVFMTSYKIFELILFATTQKSFDGKDDILRLVDWFTSKTDHNGDILKRIFDLLKGVEDIFPLMNALLDGRAESRVSPAA